MASLQKEHRAMSRSSTKPRRTAQPRQVADDQIAELRARAEALAAEYGAPLPEGDAGLIEAERRLREFEDRRKALYQEFEIDIELEKELIIPTVTEAQISLQRFIETTPPISSIGAALKLRYLADPRTDLLASVGASLLVRQVLSLIERQREQQLTAFKVVCDMESEIDNAEILVEGLGMTAAEAMHDDDKLAAFLARIAWIVSDHCKAAEEKRGELWQLLNPSHSGQEESPSKAVARG